MDNIWNFARIVLSLRHQVITNGIKIWGPNVGYVMNIIIRDDQGLDTALMMDGYSKEERQEAKQIIRSQFRETSHKVFEEVLDKPLPDSMTINMAISDREELSGENGARLASFNVALSKANSAMFTIREITVKTILDHKDLTLFKSTVTHEMFHAADKQMLENSHRLFDDIRNDIAESSDDFNRHNEDANVALLRTLLVFNHYRAEGVALLGESLLMKTKFGSVNGAIERFCSLFELTMMRARMRTSGKRSVDIFDKNISHEAYSVAPIILLLVLGKRREISPELSTKALRCLESGGYELTDEETITIMRAALSITLIGYMQGLTTLGNQVSPIRPFLDFCASVQQDADEDNVSAYENLITSNKTADNFNAAMDQIMGSCMSEEELDKLYAKFKDSKINDALYPHIKEKVASLYSIFKNDDNADRQRLAQWALTYFFDDEDIIHDDVSGLGLIDDLTVIDYATKLLQ